MPRERRGLRGDSLLEVTVGDDGEDAVINDRVSWAVELFGKASLCDGHTNAVREPLAEWASGRFDAGGQAELWVPRGERAPLAERAEVIKGQAVAGEMNE